MRDGEAAHLVVRRDHPYPLLISTVVVPDEVISATNREAFARSVSSLASRVAISVAAIPPAV